MKKSCTNVACAFNKIEVDTDATKCIGCERKLTGINTRVDAMFKDLLGPNYEDVLRKRK